MTETMRIQDLIGNAISLPSIPKIARELIESFSNNTAHMELVSNKLKLDHALSAKVLRLANSAKYSRNRTVESIDSAAIILGIDILKTLVISSGVTSAFKKNKNLDGLWHSSFMMAEIMKFLAMLKQLDQETGFTLGLLHNLGQILVASLKPEMFRQFLAESNAEEPIYTTEKRIYGMSSASIGKQLAEQWSFPNIITNSIGSQDKKISSQDDQDNLWPEILMLSLAIKEHITNPDSSTEQKQSLQILSDRLDLEFDLLESKFEIIQSDTESYMALLE